MPHYVQARKYGVAVAPKVSTPPTPELQVQGQRLKLRGVTVFGLIDHVTSGGAFGAGKVGFAKYMEENRTLVCKTVKEWGGNLIRLRVLAEEYEAATNYGASKSNYAKAVEEWVTAANAQGLYTMIAAWDPLDNEAKKEAGWIANQSYINPMFLAFHEKFKTLEKVFYEPVNEPNHMTEAQNVTNWKTTIKYFRETMKYSGVIVYGGTEYSNSGTSGAGYNTAKYDEILAEDKTQMEAAGFGSKANVLFAKHDYANEYAGKTWSEASWLGACGGAQTKYCIFETEFGNYNGSEATVDATWSKSAAKFFYERFSQANYAGASAFMMGPWFDKNRITKNHESEGEDSITSVTSPWGEVAKGFLEEKLQESTLSPVLAGVDMNNTGGEADWLRAATAGAKVGRAEEGRWTLDNATKFALKYGMKICWLFNENENKGRTFEEMLVLWTLLPANQRETIIAFEYLNESWPGGIGQQFSGEAYGNKFIQATEVGRARSLKIPILMQVRFDSTFGKTWMESLAKVNHTKLKEALEPTALLPTGNWLASHPYYNKFTLAQKEPKNLANFQDTTGNNWGSQRILKEVAYIKELTGLNVPCAVTEYGVRSGGTFGSVNSVEGWPKVAEYTKLTFEWLKTVENGTVPAANFPTGLTSIKIPFFIWFAEYSFSAENSYGFISGTKYPKTTSVVGDPNEEANFYKVWKEGATSL